MYEESIEKIKKKLDKERICYYCNEKFKLRFSLGILKL